MRRKVIVAGIAILFLVSASSNLVEAKGKPVWAEEKNRWILKNDKISVWFQGKKPMLKVFKTGEDENKSGYMVKIQEIFEKEKENKVASINLEQARPHDWKISSETENNTLSVFLSASISQQGKKGGNADVTLIFRINTTSAEVKFDLKIENWQWKSEDKENATLNLKMLVVNEKLKNEGKGNVSVGDKGYIKWADKAMANGKTINVTSEIGEENASASHIILTFEKSGNCSTLKYDPTFGIKEVGINWYLIAYIGTAIVIIALVAIIIGKRGGK